MSAESCAVLSAVFPLILLAFITERRNLTLKARRSNVFRRPAEWTAIASVIGLPLTIAGVEAGGLGGGFALVTWVLLGVSLLGLTVLTGFHIASAELEEDD